MRSILLAVLLPALALAEELPPAPAPDASVGTAAPAPEVQAPHGDAGAAAAVATSDAPAAVPAGAASAGEDGTARAAADAIRAVADPGAAMPGSALAEGAAAAMDPAAATGAAAGSPGAAAAAPDPAAAPLPPLAPPRRGWPKLGLAWHLGFPEFGVFGLVYRPWGWLRMTGGASYNYVGKGLHGEVSLAPLRWYVTPTLNLAGGKYLSMDPSRLGAIPEELEGLASDVRYAYLSAMLGLEVGNQRHGMFFVHAGAARISLASQGTARFESEGESDGGGTANATVEASGLSVRSFVPAVKFGWIIFL